MLNGLTNYLMSVKLNDKYRYFLVIDPNKRNKIIIIYEQNYVFNKEFFFYFVKILLKFFFEYKIICSFVILLFKNINLKIKLYFL